MGIHRWTAVLLVIALALPAAGAAQSHAGQPAAPESRGFWGTVVHAVGGAVVGGWLGWVGAQISEGDWAENQDGDLMGQRTSWVAGGMVVGLVASQLIGPTSAPALEPQLRPERADRNVLTRAELDRSGAATVYDVVARERPRWLTPRGTNRWAESARGQVDDTGGRVVEGETRIWVYMDGVRLGGPEKLKELSPTEIERAEFIEPARAATLYGAGHVHGVIRLVQRMGTPPR